MPLEKIRTSARAIARLVELTLDRAGADAVDVAVQHLDAPERAAAVVAALTDRLPGARSIVTGEIGAVVGAHTGPGTVGVVVLRRPPGSAH